MEVFLSYASEDRLIADAIAVGLRQDGHEVFFDRDSLPPAEGYHAAIRQAIDRSGLFVFLVSPESLEASSYATTELGLARKRWHDPSGHVLPVIVRQTPTSQIPAYLSAVTVLEASGNLVAEVLAIVANIARSRRRKWFVQLAAGVGAAVVLTGVGVWWFDYQTLRAPCYLTAKLWDVGSANSIPPGMVLDVTHGASTKSFLVSEKGLSAIDVGPLVRASQTWTIQLKNAEGVVVGQQLMQGCIDSPKTIQIGRSLELVVSPR